MFGGWFRPAPRAPTVTSAELVKAHETIRLQAKRIQELEALATERKEIADQLADQKVELEQRIETLRNGIGNLNNVIRNQRRNLDDADRAIDIYRQQTRTLADAARYMAVKAGASPAEINQLGIPLSAEDVKALEAKGGTGFKVTLKDDPLDLAGILAACDTEKATKAQFRIFKQRVQSIVTYVDVMLAGLDKLGRANVVTKEDLRKLRQFRDDLKVARETGVIEIKEVEVDG